MNTDASGASGIAAIGRAAGSRRDEGAVLLRVGAEPATVDESMGRLDAQGLVERRETPRLTMAGLALAVALLPPQKAARPRATLRRTPRAA